MLNNQIARNPTQSRYPGLWQGLIGAWSPCIAHGGTLLDLSLSTPANGTPTNFGSSALYVPSSKGMALQFTSSLSTYVNLGNPAKLALLSPYSICIWQQSIGSFVSYRNLIFKGDSFGAEFGIIINSSGQWQGQVNTGGVFTDMLVLGKWHHLVVTYDGSSILSYRDGVVRSSVTAGNATRGSIVTLGADTVNGRYFNGLIGETLFYNRILKTGEIAALYSGASPFIRKRILRAKTNMLGLQHRLAVI